jgi:hypothetical protein
MTKTQIRILKSHYGSRWHLYRHNRKNKEKKLLLGEKFIINNVLPGPVLAHQCLGEIYQGILDVHTDFCAPVSTVLLINNVEFKYKTVDELVSLIADYKKYLKSEGRIIVTLDITCLRYDRLNISLTSLCNQLIESFIRQKFSCNKHLVDTKNVNGLGHLLLSLTHHD